MLGRQSQQRSHCWRRISAALAAAALAIMLATTGAAQACPPGAKPGAEKSIAPETKGKPKSLVQTAALTAPIAASAVAKPCCGSPHHSKDLACQSGNCSNCFATMLAEGPPPPIGAAAISYRLDASDGPLGRAPPSQFRPPRVS